MCGIAGVSFAEGSTINRHKLLSSLLVEAEVRGRDAAGYAWVTETGDGLYKKNVSGSKLHVGKLPADAESFIVHTRMATHGTPAENDNNHPVSSPSGNIRLVHNGVIYNHESMRTILGGVGKKLPEVDSSVIPAMLEVFGIDSTEHIAGQAACAWFDRETDNTLHVARFNGSPLSYVWLADGSFVFASTGEILGKALQRAGLQWIGSWPTPFETFSNGDYIQVLGGEILQETETEWNTVYSKPASSGWVNATKHAGNHGTVPSTVVHTAHKNESTRPAVLEAKPSEDKAVAVPSAGQTGSTFFASGEERMTPEDYAFWRNHGYLPEEIDTVLAAEEADDAEKKAKAEANSAGEDDDTPNDGEGYYIVEHEGDESSYRTRAELLTNLAWLGGLVTGPEGLVGPEEGLIRWVNTVADVGSYGEDGREQVSWVRNKGMAEELNVPSYVLDGLSKLRELVGA